jgi:uncharacterized protein YjbJ (UPF0337 family)
VNEDRIVGATRNLVGEAEHGLGGAVGDDKLKSDGVIEQVTGSIQHGYGQIKDVIDDAPGALAGAVDRSRELGRQGEQAVRERLGDNGPLYLLAGAVALFAISAFTLTRSAPAHAPKPNGKRRSGSAKSH